MAVVCIAGMHRSATSMVAHLLNLNGIYLGNEADLVPASFDDTDGFWGNRQFVLLNDEILAGFGGAWDLAPNLPAGWEMHFQLVPVRIKAAQLIKQFEGHENWGWKDPRNSFTIPFWKQLIPDLKVVICLRNPLEVARSLGKRNLTSSALGLNLWLSFNKYLLASVAPENRIITHYDTYFGEPRSELRRILKFLHVPYSEETMNKAVRAISTPLRHNHVTLSELLDERPPKELLEVYSNMCAEAGPEYQLIPNNDSVAFLDASNNYEQLLTNRETELLKVMLIKREQEARDLSAIIAEKEQKLQSMSAEVDALQTLLPYGTRRRSIFNVTWKGARILSKEGIPGVWNRLKQWLVRGGSNQQLTERDLAAGNIIVHNPHDAIVLVSHDARTGGSSHLALHLARVLQQDYGKQVITILLDGGPLEHDFEKYSRVFNVHLGNGGSTGSLGVVDNLVLKLSEQGLKYCIANTALSGSILPVIKSHGFDVITLIHELPTSIIMLNAAKAANNIARLSDSIVFPAEFVRQQFVDNFGPRERNVVVRPQGILYHSAGGASESRGQARDPQEDRSERGRGDFSRLRVR